MADNTDKLVGQNYTTPDLVAKVTGQGEVRRRLPGRGDAVREAAAQPDAARARVVSIDTSAALAMPGVKAILTVDDLPGVAAGAEPRRERQRASAIRPSAGSRWSRCTKASRFSPSRRSTNSRPTEAIESDSDRVRAAAVRGRSDCEPAARRRERPRDGQRLDAAHAAGWRRSGSTRRRARRHRPLQAHRVRAVRRRRAGARAGARAAAARRKDAAARRSARRASSGTGTRRRGSGSGGAEAVAARGGAAGGGGRRSAS